MSSFSKTILIKTSLLINNYFVSSSFLLYLVHILIQIWFFVFSWDILNSTFVPVRVNSSRRHRLPTWCIVCKRSDLSVKGKKWLNLILIRLSFIAKCATIYILLLLCNIYIAHYITITLSASHYKTIKIIQDTNWYEVKVKSPCYATKHRI